MLYFYPYFGQVDFHFVRLGGSGLGNILMPLARSIVAADKYENSRIINPTWPSLKIGPLVRNESDKRLYANLFNKKDEWVGFPQKSLLLLHRSKHISEDQFLVNSNSCSDDKVVIYSGMKDSFLSIKNEHSIVRKTLLEITKERHKKAIHEFEGNEIVVHIRLGDFSNSPNGNYVDNEHVKMYNYRTSIEWYTEKINQVRECFGTDTPVKVFSDGKDDEISQILKLEKVKRASFGSSIADIWGLSMGRVLIASGSTFSMWGSYLGQMPVIWPYQEMRQRLYVNKNGYEIELKKDDELSEEFIQILKYRNF